MIPPQAVQPAATYAVAAAAAYLGGAIPFGLIVARARGIDIRLHGSGNIGATNVFRVVGKPWGILTFALDFLKGFFPVCLFPFVADRLGLPVRAEALQLAAAVAAVAGHNWPVYLGFRGGKGVATSAGALAGLAWPALLVGLAAWGLVFAASRYVSLASIVAAVATAGAAWGFYAQRFLPIPVVLTLLAIVLIWRHRANIGRLCAGTEHRFGRRGGPRPPPGAGGGAS